MKEDMRNQYRRKTRPVGRFETSMPLDQLIASFGTFLPFIHTKLDIVLFNALPFNILKGLVIGGFTMLTYKRLTPVLKGR